MTQVALLRMGALLLIVIGVGSASLGLAMMQFGFERVASMVDTLSADADVASFTRGAFLAIVAGLAAAGIGLVGLAGVALLQPHMVGEWLSLVRRPLLETLASDWRRLGRDLLVLRPYLRSAVVAALLTFAAYAALGGIYIQAGLYDRNETIFSADFETVRRNLTRFRTDHTHGNSHPMFLVFFTAPGVLLAHSVRSESAASLVMTATAGALSVGITYLLLRALAVSMRRALVWSAVLAASTAHSFFSAVPETYIFTALGMSVLGLLVAVAPGNTAGFALATVYALGVTVTNALHGFAAFLLSRRDTVEPRDTRARFATLVVSVALIATALNGLQVVF